MDFFDSFFKLYSGEGHIAAATCANDAYITADAEDGKPLFAAGVGLFQFENIAHGNFYNVSHSSLLNIIS